MMNKMMTLACLSVIVVILTAGCGSGDKGSGANMKVESALLHADFEGTALDLTRTWYFEGQGIAQIDNGKLALQDTGVGVVLWTRQDFPSDMRLQFDLSFSNNQGIGVFFIAAHGMKGEDILSDQPERDGAYDLYTKGDINCYGISLHRFFPDGRHNPGTNIRKNSGFHLANHVEPDPIMNSNQTYRVHIEKDGGHLRLWVDGNLVHDWVDDGSFNAVLGGGKIGFRIRGHRSCIMHLDNIVIDSFERSIE